MNDFYRPPQPGAPPVRVAPLIDELVRPIALLSLVRLGVTAREFGLALLAAFLAGVCAGLWKEL